MQQPFLDSARKHHPGLPLIFDRPLVVVGGGVLDADVLKALAPACALVGADGGADVMAAAGLMPEAVIGDMDSLSDPDTWANHTRLIRLDEQDSTDFEKCLYCTRAPVTLALGMTGKRLDHTLAALDAAARYADRRLIFVDSDDLALVVQGDFNFDVEPGDRVSIHPLGDVSFAHTEGLKYPLDGLTLAPGRRTGTSNAATKGPVSIQVAPDEQAPYLVLVDRAYLNRFIAAAAS